jgi:hypothetical protein
MIEDILYSILFIAFGLYSLSLSVKGKKLYVERDNYVSYSHANERIMYGWKLFRVLGYGCLLFSLKLFIDFFIKLFNALF